MVASGPAPISKPTTKGQEHQYRLSFALQVGVKRLELNPIAQSIIKPLKGSDLSGGVTSSETEHGQL